jgi:branched-chain amino acid transport system permease protein
VVTVALLVICIGLAEKLYPANTSRTVLGFFPGRTVHIGSTVVTYHQLITIFASVVVAVGLYLLLNRTRIGIAMRASVDNPELLRLFGGKPSRCW